MTSNTKREVSSNSRELHGWQGVIAKLLLILIPVIGIFFILDLPGKAGLLVWKEQYIGVFLSLVLASVFITISPTKQGNRKVVPWYDLALAFVSVTPGIYIALFYPRVSLTLPQIVPERVFLGVILILLSLEATRRLFGWVLVILASVFIFYGGYTNLFPGFLAGKSVSWASLIQYLYLDPNSFIWLAGIAGTLILAFIIFGQVIFSFGGGAVLTEFSLGLMGGFRGGPAKVAIVGSSLFGTLSGTSTANVLVTGSVTIPLMKKIGYKPHVAGAIETVASCGGMIMPPVMGAAAFILADIVGLSYSQVAIAAFIPAFLYYVSLFVQVDLEAAKMGLKGLPRGQLPQIMPILRRGWLILLPLVFLIYVLFVIRLHPTIAAAYSVIFGLLLAPLAKENRVQFWRRFLTVLEESGKALLGVGMLLTVAGLVVAVVGFSGLGFKMSVAFVQLGSDNTLLLLVVAAIASVALGMGLPISASYILVAVMVAPALVQLGLPILAAHLFVLYYANLAGITPPVALTAFIAAGIARSEPMSTGYYSMKLAILAYIVPFLFVFSPALLLNDTPWAILIQVGTAMLATFAAGISLTGYLFHKLPLGIRALIGIGALILFISVVVEMTLLGLMVKVVGGLVVIPLISWLWRQREKSAPLKS